MNKKNRKEILLNIVSLGSMDVLGMLIPLITMPIVTRALGIEVYGQYLLFMTMLSFGHTLIDYGVQYSGVRAASRNLTNDCKLKTCYSEYQGIRICLSALFLFLSCIYSAFIFDSCFVFLFLFFYVCGYFLSSTWFFQAIGKTNLILYASLINKLILLIVVVGFISSSEDYLLLLFASTVPIFITSLFLFFYLKVKYNVLLYVFDTLKSKLIEGGNIFLGVLAPNLYNSIPLIILGNIADKNDFAQMAVSLKICGVIFTIQNVIAKSMYPVVSRTKNSKLKAVLLVNVIVTIPIAIVLFFWGERVIYILLGLHLNSELYLQFISVSLIFVAISNAFSIGYFLPMKLDIDYRNIILSVSFVSAFISFYLIYNYGVLGGVVGLFCARFLLMSSYINKFLKTKKTNIGNF